MSQLLYNELMKQAEQLTTAEQLRLAEHLECMATRSHPLNQVSPHLEDILAHRDRILEIAQQHGARNIRIMGSVARDEAKADSDVDFLLDLGESLSPWFPVKLIRELSALLGRKLDIVIADSLPDEMRQGILNEAIAIPSSDSTR